MHGTLGQKIREKLLLIFSICCLVDYKDWHIRSDDPGYPLAEMNMKLEKTRAFTLPVTTKPNKQGQRLNLHGCFIQMACDLRRRWVHTLTDHLTFSFQASLFITGNIQNAVRGFEIQGKLDKRKLQHSPPGQYLFPGAGSHLSLPGTQWLGCFHLFPRW